MDCRRFKTDIASHILNAPHLTPELRAELDSHMAGCPACREVYAQAKLAIALSSMTDKEFADELARIEPALEPPEAVEAAWQRLKAEFEARDEEKRKQRVKRLTLVRRAAAIAASLLIIAGLGSVAMRTFSSPGAVMLATGAGAKVIPFGQEIRTGILEQKTLRLGPAHNMVVNAGTALTVSPLHHWLKTGYLVTLKTGELYVEVTHDGKPFTVRTPDAEAVITGTKFDIHVLPGKTDLTLLEGSIRFTGGGNTVVVTAGEMSTVSAGLPPSAPKPVESLAQTDWAREKMVQEALARRNLTADDAMLKSIAESWPGSAPPDPEKLDYTTWRDAHQNWFAEQFPWIFKTQATLKAEHGIQADYIELLMVSGDIWQFHYPRQYPQRIPVFDPLAIERIADHYGLSQTGLIQAAKPARWAPSETISAQTAGVKETDPSHAYRTALQEWRAALAEAEKQTDISLSGDLFLFSIGACNYLTNTRTAAYLWIKEHPERAEELLMDPTCRLAIADLSYMRKPMNNERALATLARQSVSAAKAQNFTIQAIMDPPQSRNDHCRYGCREAQTEMELSKLILPLAE